MPDFVFLIFRAALYLDADDYADIEVCDDMELLFAVVSSCNMNISFSSSSSVYSSRADLMSSRFFYRYSFEVFVELLSRYNGYAEEYI